MKHENWCHFVIYNSPADFPGRFIVRRWQVTGPKVQALEVYANEPTLEAVRAKIPRGHVCVPRAKVDDPVIVETWL